MFIKVNILNKKGEIKERKNAYPSAEVSSVYMIYEDTDIKPEGGHSDTDCTR